MKLIFEWDEKKNESNRAKHGLSFETAVLIFQDPNLLSVLDTRYEDEEERWISIGRIDANAIYVAHTVREEDGEEIIRIISARKATPREERRYFTQ